MNQFKDFNIKPKEAAFIGDKIKIERVLNVEISVFSYKIEDSKKKPGTKFMTIQIEKGNDKNVIFTGSTVLMDMIEQVPKDKFPFKTKITKDNDRLEFT